MVTLEYTVTVITLIMYPPFTLRGQSARCVNTQHKINNRFSQKEERLEEIKKERSNKGRKYQHVCVGSYCKMAEFIILSNYFRLCTSVRKANTTVTVYLSSNSQPAKLYSV